MWDVWDGAASWVGVGRGERASFRFVVLGMFLFMLNFDERAAPSESCDTRGEIVVLEAIRIIKSVIGAFIEGLNWVHKRHLSASFYCCSLITNLRTYTNIF